LTLSVVPAQSCLVMLPKNCWPRVQGSVVIQLYTGECTLSVDWALMAGFFPS